MATVNIHEAKTHLSKLLERSAAGEDIVIARAGTPIARLVAYKKVVNRKPGIWHGQVRIAEDFDVLPSELESAFHGEEP